MEGMLTKGKGGRAGRFPAKKNKNSHTPTDVTRASTKKPPLVENNTSNCYDSSIEVIQSLQIPAIEKETLSSAINDTIIQDPCEEDKEQMDLVMPGSYPETGRGMMGSSGEKATLISSRSDERTSGNSLLLCPSVGEIENDSSGPFYQGIDNAPYFNEVTDKELLDPNGGSTLNEERQSGLVVHTEEGGNRVLSPKNTVFESIGYLSSNGESGDEWYSCSSIRTSGFDYWSWDDVMGGHAEGGDEIQEDSMLSWLRESDEVEGESAPKLEEADDEKKNAMAAWLLS
ncbi:hypothetical protein SADUNF_Sadunf02G0167100 [Salix dunnii]|uniref:Uncharacterized protein n=1 Tax=Salix dunnii TaxID=1413687 RepID=A0A835N8E4_9ROSI|nr:hypothetical protein SADUNF_Sadunf02G0167100 [Salix dunnii]